MKSSTTRAFVAKKQSTFSAQVANKLFSTIASLRLLLVMFLTLTVSANVWGQEELVYTLTPTSGSNNSYTGTCDVEIDGITWNLAGNSTVKPWRIGGKSLTNVDRALYSKTPISNNISKIIIEHGTASSITVNSVKLFVSTKENGTGTIISELSNSFEASSTMTFTRPDGKDWTNAYYKIVYNVTVSSTSNKYLQFTNAKFYSSGGGGSTTVDPEVTFSNGEYTIGGAALDLSTLWESNSTGAVTYSVTNAGTTGATVNGTSFTATAAGTCTVQASQAATATHNAATATATITVTAPAGGGEGECSWTLVTDASTLKADDEVIITASGENNYALSTNQKSSNRSATAITKNGNTLTSPSADVQILALKAGSTSGTWAFYTGTSGYLYAASSSGNQLKTKTTLDEHGSWTISITDGVASIAAEVSSNRNVMQYNYNNGSPLFACYASASQTSLAIYKKVCTTETSYSVTYNGNGNTSGSVPTGATEYAKDAQVTVLGNTGNLAKTGYTFSGWNTEANGTGTTTYAEGDKFTITENTTLYAKWTANTYTITLNANGGSGNTTSVAATYDSSTLNPSSITNPTKTGHTFDGWYSGEGGTGSLVINSSGKLQANVSEFTGTNGVWKGTTDKTLYAKWTPAVYTINYKDQDNAAFSGTHEEGYPQTHTYNTATTLKSASKDHYTFGGWYKESNCSGTEVTTLGATEYTENITLYAKWTANTYTITFNAGTGECGTSSAPTTNADGVTLPTANPPAACATDGWTFAGWWTEAVAETPTSPGELLTAGSNYKPASDCTLYAVYSYTEAGGGGSGFYLSVTQDATTYYIGEKGSGSFLSAVTDINSAATFNIENNQYLYYGNKTYVSSTSDNTSLTIATTTPSATWAITDEGETITFKSNGTGGCYLAFNYNGGSPRFSSYNSTYTYELTKHTTSTTTYNSNPSCEVCENILTINKGAETNGTFTLSKSGEIETCDGDVVVTVSEISPAEHYSVSAVTATTPTSGGTPTITNNGDGTWTVTYAQNSKGESTINVTFVEDSKATITLSELGVENTDNTTYYVGETYTLPTTSSQSCAGKQLVGWSRVEVAETDTKPTENYYELGAEVTLAATQTFYAVFATAGEGGGGEYTLVTSANDFTDGVYVIAALDNGTYYFIDGNCENKGLGVEANGLAASEVNNGSFSELSLPSGSVEIEFEDDGEPLDGNHYYFVSYYDETISNWKFLNDDGTKATLKWVEWYDGLTVYTYHPVFDTKTYLLSGSSAAISQNGTTKASFIRNYANGTTYNSLYFFKKTGSSATYTAYSTSCIPTYSITYDFAGGTGSHCSNTSVPQGDPYTICDEAPTKEGHTFLGWSDGINIYQPNNSFTPEADITLTAIWQINTYTVIWSNNGATTPVEYNHGVALVVPEAPESCDGVKEFVGWTTHSGYYHATTAPDDIFTTKTTPVTADATYYAVFATPPGTGGGGGGSETTTTLDFTAQGYANETAISNLTVDGVTATFAKGSNGSNAPKYYTSGTAIRAYGGNTITLSANQITAATFTFGSSDGSNEITADCGSWDSPTWTGDATDEVVFTISGSSGNRRIQSIAVTYTIGGGSGSYSDYTTTCQQVESIEVQNPKTEFYLTDDFTIGEGKVMATLSDGITKVDVTSLATFSGYNMEVVGTYTVTVTYMGATATYNINVKPLDNAWVLTWNVSGKTNTGLGPRYVTKGSAIGTLPTPEVPAACAGKTFMGWTTSNIVPSDGVGIEYITEETVPTDNTTYYAVFATVNNFSVQKPIEDIESGSKVVVVAVASLTADGGSGKAISSRTISITSQGVIGLSGDEVSISDETINTPHSTCIWTLTKEGGGIVLEQDGKYIRAVDDGYRKLLLETTKDYWTLTPIEGKYQTYYMQSGNTEHYVEWFDHTDDKYDEGEKYIGFVPYIQANDYGDFDMQFFVTLGDNADITDYTTGCEEYTITYYGFRGGYSTSTSSDGIIVLPVNSLHTVPDCGDVVTDHTNLGREFLDVWMTQPHGGHTFKPGDTFILTQDTTLYAQWKMETTSDVTTLPTDIEDLAGTDVYVYGGKTLNIQPGSTTINSLTLKGGLQSDGSYKMPIVWVPEGATLVRNSNKIYLDLVVNAKNYYPFAVPFATKNDQYLDYLDPVLNAASTYGTHFVIKTYDGARRATKGEDRDNNWGRVLRHQSAENPSYLQPGVGYIITALTYPDKDTATIRIPMTVPNTWFENGEQAVVGTTVRKTIAVTAHGGAAATEHQRHAGWNFVASPYLTNFAGGNVENNGGLEYINGELTVNGGWVYGGDPVPYVTIPAYDFSYYTQHKLSDVKLSPEWSFFVQIGTSGTMNFSTDGRQEIPASIAARHDAAQSIRMDVDIVLSDKHHSDQMGLIICDRFTSAYEIGYDLEKMFGSAYNLTVYTLMEDNTPLAYQALAIHSNMQVIPVGYRVPEQGDYTFALNQSTSSIDLLNEQYEQLILVDYETGALTNLLNSSYTFTSPRTQSNSRFAIYAVMRQDIPTDLPNIDDGDTSTRKILHNGHLYILREGKVYNGHGQIVK